VDDPSIPEWHAFRVRRGWGVALRVDCHATCRSPPRDESLNYPRRLASPESETLGNESTEKEASWHGRDRWLFDADDEPSVGRNPLWAMPWVTALV
jgi:hypothetical protein